MLPRASSRQIMINLQERILHNLAGQRITVLPNSSCEHPFPRLVVTVCDHCLMSLGIAPHRNMWLCNLSLIS